jgi:hypothetical protein
VRWGGRARTCNVRGDNPAVCQLTYAPGARARYQTNTAPINAGCPGSSSGPAARVVLIVNAARLVVMFMVIPYYAEP